MSEDLSEHLSERDLADFTARRMDPRRVQAAGKHVRACASCAAAVDRSLALARSAEELWQNATSAEAETAHWMRRRRRRRLAAAIAAMIATIAATFLFIARREQTNPRVSVPRELTPRRADPPTASVLLDGPHRIRISGTMADVSYGRDDWDALAREAFASQRIDVVRIAALRPAVEHLRGPSHDPAAVSLREPVGITVASERPVLSWSSPAGAIHSVVVADADGNVIARASGLRGDSWAPPRPLLRGKTYAWQLTVTAPDGQTSVIPAPSAPPALFAILEAGSAREAESARAAGAHLIAALLYARHGAAADAERELAAFASQNPGAPLPAALQRSLSAQRGEPTSTNADQ